MRVFCDTNVFVAASLEAHPHHDPAKRVLQRVSRRDDAGFAAAHSLAETFSVLSRMPTTPKLTTTDVLAILESNIIPHFTFIALLPGDYPDAIRALTAKGLGGGRIYDLLHITACRKQAFDRIYTFNDSEWKNLAPDLESVIVSPKMTVLS